MRTGLLLGVAGGREPQGLDLMRREVVFTTMRWHRLGETLFRLLRLTGTLDNDPGADEH